MNLGLEGKVALVTPPAPAQLDDLVLGQAGRIAKGLVDVGGPEIGIGAQDLEKLRVIVAAEELERMERFGSVIRQTASA